MRRPLLAANWKMNQTAGGVSEYFTNFFGAVDDLGSALKKVDLTFAVPYLFFDAVATSIGDSGVQVAAQNMHQAPSGAFTGEVSSQMLLEAGVRTVVLGHSERRQLFAETDQAVYEKTAVALEAGMLPIVCVGEKLAERESGATQKVVERQLLAILEGVGESHSIVVAYEPVWAIGTGLAATAQQAQEVHSFIRQLLEDKKGAAFASQTRILYGGSMSGKNVGELIGQQDVDGGLVGGASLKASEFANMLGTIFHASR